MKHPYLSINWYPSTEEQSTLYLKVHNLLVSNSSLMQENEVEFSCLQELINKLEYRYQLICKAHESDCANINIKYEIDDYLNTLGSIEAALSSDWLRNFAGKQDDEHWHAVYCPVLLALMPLRNKHSAHSSIFDPRKHDTKIHRISHANLPLITCWSGNIFDNKRYLIYQIQCSVEERVKALRVKHPRDVVDVENRTQNAELFISFVPLKHHKIICDEILSIITGAIVRSNSRMTCTKEIMMLPKTRRVTTGFTHSKKSDLISDEQVSTIAPYPIWPSFQLQDLFYTEDNPPTMGTRHLDKPYDLNLPEGAVRVIKIRMPTKTEMAAELQAAGQPVPEDWAKFNLHRTDSIDFIYILSGTMTCIVGDKQTLLKAGDFVAQVGPEHTWINDSDEPCIGLCIMMGTKREKNPGITEHGVHVGGVYLHRNGNKYKVLSVACNTEDLSWSVIYEVLYENKASQMWRRKLEDFLAIITLENGAQQPRFIYQGQAQ